MTRAGPLALFAAALLWAAPVPATGWRDFYAFATRPAGPAGQPLVSVCLREILAAQRRYDIPNNMLLAIGLQEAGLRKGGFLTVWPWAVNAEGEGRVFESREAAMHWVEARRAEGVRSIDVGCMQVNLRWHPEAFASLEQGFDPARNVEYAARFLRDLYYQTGEWELAAGSYHSFTPELRRRYLDTLRHNMSVANARIDEFRAVAALDDGGEAVPTAGSEPAAGGILWSSEVSQLVQGGDGIRSVYSDQALRPLLPQFLETQ